MEFRNVFANLAGQHRTKLLFVLVGVWNTIFGYGVFCLFDSFFAHIYANRQLAYMSAMILAQVLAIINAYIFHKHITFRSGAKGLMLISEFLRFCTTYMVAFVLSLILLPLFVEKVGITPKIAGAFVILVCTIISYIGHSRFSFRTEEKLWFSCTMKNFTKSPNKSFLALFFIFILDLVLLFLLIIYADNFRYRTIKTVKYTGINFNSHSLSEKTSAIKEFSETSRCKFKEVNINFLMKVYSIKEYDNVFQTAPVNSGIRMELAKPTILSLVIGYKNDEGLKGCLLTDSLQLNKWYSVKISIDKHNHLKVLLDNFVVVDDLADKYINYNISDIAIGTGFSKTRPFNGAIDNFSFKYRLSEKLKSIAIVCFLIEALLILLLVIIFYYIIKNLRNKKNQVKNFLNKNNYFLGFLSILFFFFFFWLYFSINVITFGRDDNTIGNIPLIMDATRQILRGIFPIFSEYVGGGMPILACLQIGALNPLSFIPAAFLINHPSMIANFIVSLHIAIFAAGGWYLGRVLKAPFWASVIAVISLGFSVHFVTQAGSWTSMTLPYTFLPWILGSYTIIVTNRYKQIPIFHFLIAIFCPILAVYSGAPNPLVFMAIVSVSWLLFLFIQNFKMFNWKHLFICAFLVLIVVTPLLLYAVQYMKLYSRSPNPQFFRDFSVPLSSYLGAFWPTSASVWKNWWGGRTLLAPDAVLFSGCVPAWFYFWSLFSSKQKLRSKLQDWPLWVGLILLVVMLSPASFGLEVLFTKMPILNMLRMPVRGCTAFNVMVILLFLLAASKNAFHPHKSFSLLLVGFTILVSIIVWNQEVKIAMDVTRHNSIPEGWFNTGQLVPQLYNENMQWRKKDLDVIRSTEGQVLSIPISFQEAWKFPALYFLGNTGAQFRVKTVGCYMPTYAWKPYRDLGFESKGIVTNFNASLPLLEGSLKTIRHWDNKMMPKDKYELIAKSNVTAVVVTQELQGVFDYFLERPEKWVLLDTRLGAALFIRKACYCHILN